MSNHIQTMPNFTQKAKLDNKNIYTAFGHRTHFFRKLNPKMLKGFNGLDNFFQLITTLFEINYRK